MSKFYKDHAEHLSRWENDSWGRHEAMHMAWFLAGAVEGNLCSHPAIEAHPEWEKLAHTAFKSLLDLYEAVNPVSHFLAEQNQRFAQAMRLETEAA